MSIFQKKNPSEITYDVNENSPSQPDVIEEWKKVDLVVRHLVIPSMQSSPHNLRMGL
jgi:hypothetical protein